MAGTLTTGGNNQSIITSAIVANESLFRLNNTLFMPRLADRSREKYFEAKIGNKVSIKRPFKIKGSTGRTLTDAQITPLIDETVDLYLNKRFKFALGELTDEDFSLHVRDFGNRYLQAGVEEVAEYVDEQCLRELTLGCATVAVAGASSDIDTTDNHIKGSFIGNKLTTEMTQYIRSHATQVAIPQNSQNYAIINPEDCASLSHDIKEIHVPKWVTESLRARFRGQIANWNTFESNHVPNYVVADYGSSAGLVNASNGYQGSSLPTDGWQAAGAGQTRKLFHKGQMICIHGVYEVNPRGERQSTGRLKSFVVTSDVSITGTATAVNIPISPELNAGTNVLTVTTGSSGETVSKDAFQNVSANAANNAQIYTVGEKGKTYRQSVFYEKTALTFVPVMLKKMGGGIDSSIATDPRSGVTVAISHQAEIKEMDAIWRGDVLFGALCQYPEVALRVLTNEI